MFRRPLLSEGIELRGDLLNATRSVTANIAEAWRKRRYEAAFIAKLNDAEGEAAETQTWLEFAVKCNYVSRETALQLFKAYDEILAMLVSMIVNNDKWVFPSGHRNRT